MVHLFLVDWGTSKTCMSLLDTGHGLVTHPPTLIAVMDTDASWQGITLGPGSGRVMADLIMGRETRGVSLEAFSPSRF